ncbi:MAG: NAD(P)H-hydrate epimerase [Candidatus Omnitrophica bacterium]|nr:NAD(P)H-hydrate epimerase [Candidatus Omnitrophota bacterium]
MKHVTVAQMREYDRRAIEEYEIPAMILMENAGLRAAEVAAEIRPSDPDTVCVLCGKGNNAGDGFVCARHLLNKGMRVVVVCFGREDDLSPEAAANYRILTHMDAEILLGASAREGYSREIDAAGLVIDALCGVGIQGALREPLASVVHYLNHARKPVLALDVPSGLNADDGTVEGMAVRAQTTVTFAFPKRGFIQADGPEFCGRVVVADISIPRERGDRS